MKAIVLTAASLALLALTTAATAQAGGEGARCGGYEGLQCGTGFFCEHAPDGCGWADMRGVCVAVPEVCTRQFAPVCGCDGRTYGNECQRRAARVQKKADGPC